MKVEVAVLGSASLIALNKYGLFGREATLKSNLNHVGGIISRNGHFCCSREHAESV